ncbi:MAG TPA: DUF6599 family protein [Candidatus Angelobacter sp.]|nr:DUF6599 family protein [Candidatus Angelobacter sp.]
MTKRFFIAILVTLAGLAAFAQEPPPLPPAFNGWVVGQTTIKAGSSASAIDAADAAVLTEYGFSDYENATYTRNDRSMQIKAARFKDSSGAFGAFTFYAQPQMQKEDIGDRAVSNNSRVLFFRGNILVDVTLERVTAMSAADLRALADALPRPHGEGAGLPSLPGNVPTESLVANTARYIEGPVALERLGVPIPAVLLDFSKSRDVEFATYRTHNGEGTLTLVEYPTPQIAAERLKAWQSASLPGGPFYFRRSGPLLAAANGNLPESDAQSLLAMVNYDADVTWNQARHDRNDDRYGFIVALLILVGIVLAAATIIGLMFGGFRIWIRKLLPGYRPGQRDDVEIIRLDLK